MNDVALPSPSVPARRRGRPPGAKNKVLRTEVLGVHHFAFLRSWFQGVESHEAWKRYMDFCDPVSDPRHVESRRKQLMADILRAGEALDATLRPEHKISGALKLLARSPIAPKVVAVPPSLEAFAESIGMEDWGEAEILEKYKEHYHLDRPLEDDEKPSPEDAKAAEQVKALNQVATALARSLKLTDGLDLWLHDATTEHLQAVKVVTVGQLIDFINLHGYNWHRKVGGIGPTRARSITAWLNDSAADLNKPLSHRALAKPGSIEESSKDLVSTQRYGIVPLDQLVIDPALNGEKGVFRTGMVSTLGANNDLDAVRAWLSHYKERPHTYRSYVKEVERFLLWCVHERRKALSSVNSQDCMAYREFLRDLPDTWIQRPGARREHDSGWRPFRAQLAPSSIKQSIVIIQIMFGALHKEGYMAANPMANVSHGFDLPESKIEIKRSLTEAQWAHVKNSIELEENGAVRRRFSALLELLVATGVRLDELSNAKWKDLVKRTVDDQDAWILTVTGKRKKVREVMVPNRVVDLLKAHHADYLELANAEEGNDQPLIGSLNHRVGEKGSKLVAGQKAPSSLQPGVSDPIDFTITSAGIYLLLRRMFRRISASAPPDIDAEHLSRASTHWLRHTFGRQSAAAEMPIEVLQQTLGHASIATTTIYLTTERDRMVREMRKAQDARALLHSKGPIPMGVNSLATVKAHPDMEPTNDGTDEVPDDR